METVTAKIVRLHEAGNTQLMIANVLGITRNHVRQVLYRKGLGRTNMSQEEIDMAVSMGKRGMKIDEIAHVFNRSTSAIQYQLSKHGVTNGRGKPRTKRKPYRWDLAK